MSGAGELLDAVEIPVAADTGRRRARTAFQVAVVLVAALLAWSTWMHIEAQFAGERALAVQAAAGAARSLDRRLDEAAARLAAFAAREYPLIAGVARAPDDKVLADTLWSRLRTLFPAADGAAIADPDASGPALLGGPPTEDQLAFLRDFTRGNGRSIHIGGDRVPRVSVAAGYRNTAGAAGALAVSLGCQAFCEFLEEMTPEGHHLQAIRHDVAAPPATGRQLAQATLAEGDWRLEDRLDEGYANAIILRAAAMGLGVGAAFVLALAALHRWMQAAGPVAGSQQGKLRDARRKLRALLSATTDGVIITDPQGRIELFNPAAEMMFGRLAEDVRGTPADELLPDLMGEDRLDGFLAPRGGVQEAPAPRETRGLRQDGKDFPVRVWLSRLSSGPEPHLLIAAQDLTEQELSVEHRVFLEQRDPLTGLLNRREFERRLLLISSDDPLDGPYVLGDIDVDQFKLINDACGHEAGDELLRQLAVLVRARMGKTGTIARIGGDEFGILLPQCTVETARAICEDLRQTVRGFLFTWRDQSFDVAVSIGLVEMRPGFEGPSSLLSKADIACHMAKSRGRDRIHVYQDDDAELARHHGDMRLAPAIAKALSEDRFRLYAQPITPLQAQPVWRRHFEVLVRMLDETGNPVVPDHFIPAAERYILMPAVDRWIIKRLFELHGQTLRDWHRQVPEGFLFAVNLSATSLADEAFLLYLKRQFAEWGVPHPSICFEITETAGIRDLIQARGFIEELSALGCSFALDDFGTGLSNYGYLRELPLSYLKIDGSFVRTMHQDPVNRALVESINQIGHVLGLRTIAEWAEDRTTVEQLRALGVDFAQGYGVGEPIALSEVTLQTTAVQPAWGT
jgi:diguanylate cyclase (GGDEF)-like protein/PAS domain S-box-containing protein